MLFLHPHLPLAKEKEQVGACIISNSLINVLNDFRKTIYIYINARLEGKKI